MAKGQKEKVLDYMRRYGSISNREAFKYLDVLRLSAVIFRLKHDDGYEISSFDRERIDADGNKKRWVEYRLRGGAA